MVNITNVTVEMPHGDTEEGGALTAPGTGASLGRRGASGQRGSRGARATIQEPLVPGKQRTAGPAHPREAGRCPLVLLCSALSWELVPPSRV